METNATIKVNIKVIEANYDLSAKFGGFFWLRFEHKGEELTVQACIKKSEKYKNEDTAEAFDKNAPDFYVKKISMDDNGMTTGICSDINETPHSIFGVEACEQLIFNQARKLGFKIV